MSTPQDFSHSAVNVLNGDTSGANWKKQDNRHLSAKLSLRRYFLRKYPPHQVIDCCAGQQVIWTELRKEFPNVQYLGLDKHKLSQGIVKVAAERWLAQVEWKADVLDIDHYGEPWSIYAAALENFMGEEVTIFLTACNLVTMRGMSGIVKRRLGLPEEWKVWASHKFIGITLQACLSQALDCGFEVIEAKKVVLDGKSLAWGYNYIGLRLRWTI